MFLLFLISTLPSFLQVPLRRLLGAKIEKSVRIRPFSFLLSRNVSIGKGSVLGPFSFISSEEIQVGTNCSIKSFSIIKSSKKIILGDYVHIAPLVVFSGASTPRSSLVVGDHSRIFPFCWIDTGEGVEIGSQVGIGGHTLVFTHGVWSNYLKGGPVTFGKVIIEDGVWLPWRVFVMPGVTIGSGAIVGANSVVTKSVDSNSLVAGSPAKLIKENVISALSAEQFRTRLSRIILDFANDYEQDSRIIDNHTMAYKGFIISSSEEISSHEKTITILNKINSVDRNEVLNAQLGHALIEISSDTVYFRDRSSQVVTFVNFLRRFGIRLYWRKI